MNFFQRLAARLGAAYKAFRQYPFVEPYYVKVHGRDLSGKKYILTVQHPIAISDIAGLQGFENFREITHVEYYDEAQRVFDPAIYTSKRRADHLFGKPLPTPITPNSMSYMEGIGGPMDPAIREALIKRVNEPEYGWNDPDFGPAFKAIDLLKAKDAKPRKPRQAAKPKSKTKRPPK